jgi:ribonuclease BN (tRNA processing enzyme)
MKLTVLGGSAASVGPGQGCSGYLLEGGDTRIVLDLGPGTLPELRRHADYRTLDGIVISHMHVDHVLDLLALRFALAYNPVPAPLPVPLWLPPDGTAVLRQAGAAFRTSDSADDFFSPMFAISEYDPEASVTIGDLTMTFARTVHALPCWAMRVASTNQPGQDLVYTADTGPAARLETFAQGCAVLLSEATLPITRDEPAETRIHLMGREAGEIAAKAGAKTLVLTHMFEENDPVDTQVRAAEVFSGAIQRAVPGLVVEW